MIDWIVIVVALLAAGAGYGMFKMNPLVGGVAGIVTAVLLVGLMLSAVFGAPGFLAFFMTGWAKWLTIFATSYTVGAIAGAVF